MIPLLRAETGRVLVVSHRGSLVGLPPNSWAAIEEGHRRGADLIEVDVQISRDRVAFLRHHYTDEHGRWAWDLDYDPAYPRLDDVLAWAAGRGVRLALDLKTGFDDPGQLGRRILENVAGAEDRVLLVSWDHDLLRRIKEERPAISTLAVLRGQPADLAAVLRSAACAAVCLSYDLCRVADVDTAHAQGVAVSLGELWQPDFARVRELGVDLVAWGDPAQARALI